MDDGRLVFIPDPGPSGGSGGSASGLGDETLIVTGAGSATPEAVAALAYANMGLPLPWTPSARFTVSYANLSSPPSASVVKATTWTQAPGQISPVPSGVAFRINPVDGRLTYMGDTQLLSLGDDSLIVTGALGTPDTVATLFYANGCWTSGAKFTVSYASLINPVPVNVVRATTY